MTRMTQANSASANGGNGASAPRRRPTLRMVADLAGVSTATVSYVFSGRGGGGSGVAEHTAARVHAAARELNYRPNRAARTIRTGRSDTVQLSLHMLSDPWSLAVADGTVAFVRDGLLDPKASPETLCKLVPKSLPSGRTVAEFEDCD